MPIIFEQPSPMAPGVSVGEGMVSQYNKDRDAAIRAASLASHRGGAGATHYDDSQAQADRHMEMLAYQQSQQGQVTPRDQFAAAHQAAMQDQHYQQQLGLQEAQLNIGERMQLQQLQQADSAISMQLSNGEITPQQANEMRSLVRMPRMMLEARNAQTVAREHAMRTRLLEQEVEHQTILNARRTHLNNALMNSGGQSPDELPELDERGQPNPNERRDGAANPNFPTIRDPATGNEYPYFLNDHGVPQVFQFPRAAPTPPDRNAITPQLRQTISNQVHTRMLQEERAATDITNPRPPAWFEGGRRNQERYNTEHRERLERELGLHGQQQRDRQEGGAIEDRRPIPQTTENAELPADQRETMTQIDSFHRLAAASPLPEPQRRALQNDVRRAREIFMQYGSEGAMPTTTRREYQALIRTIRNAPAPVPARGTPAAPAQTQPYNLPPGLQAVS